MAPGVVLSRQLKELLVDIHIPDRLEKTLKRLNPSRDGLLGWMQPRISNKDLQEISRADYGDSHPKHYAALLRIRNNFEFDAPMAWEPCEVLELTRWDEVEVDDDSQHVHRLRAFACAALITAGGDPSNCDHVEGENTTLIQLVESVLALGNKYVFYAVSLIAWRMLGRIDDLEEAGLWGLGLLYLLPSIPPDRNRSDLILLLCEWIESIELKAAQELDYVSGQRWLLDLAHFDLLHDKWVKFAGEIRFGARREISEDAVDAAGRIFLRIAKGQ